MVRKKEDPEKVKARVKKYLTTKHQLLITGLSEKEKEYFNSLKGLETLSHKTKLIVLMDFWNNGDIEKPLSGKRVNKLEPNLNEKKETIIEEKAVIIPRLKIKDWQVFEEDLLEFLKSFKKSGERKPGLRDRGKKIVESLETDEEHWKAYLKISGKLSLKLLMYFKPLYRKGYFYFFSTKDIIEISKQKYRDNILLLLAESFKNRNSKEPVKEAKRKLGL